MYKHDKKTSLISSNRNLVTEVKASKVLQIREVADKILDVLLEEANPDNWLGADMHILTYSEDTRYERAKAKSIATTTANLLNRIHAILEYHKNDDLITNPDEVFPSNVRMVREIEQAHRQSEILLAKLEHDRDRENR